MHPELRRHPEYFKKEIVKLADNVYQAFGFAASNVYMLIGKDGLVIVDTTETNSQLAVCPSPVHIANLLYAVPLE